MKKSNRVIVITTINDKSDGIREFESLKGWHTVLVGDKKSVSIESNDSLTFLSWEEQLDLDLNYVKLCPWNHYARKNIGYLYAIKAGAKIIYDTDDDNIPYLKKWKLPEFKCNKLISNNSKFVNMYSYFTDELVWPRGLPLDEIHTHYEKVEVSENHKRIGIWQGLADNDPDVDAIFRLAFKKEVVFKKNEHVVLSKGLYSPINSQNTFWHSNAFPFLYLPAFVNFRATDIYRGYLAQKLLWHLDYFVGFTGATVYQERNKHNLMQDLRDEFECYFNIKNIIKIIDKIELTSDSHANIKLLYESLSEEGIISSKELDLLDAWLIDFMNISDTKKND